MNIIISIGLNSKRVFFSSDIRFLVVLAVICDVESTSVQSVSAYTSPSSCETRGVLTESGNGLSGLFISGISITHTRTAHTRLHAALKPERLTCLLFGLAEHSSSALSNFAVVRSTPCPARRHRRCQASRVRFPFFPLDSNTDIIMAHSPPVTEPMQKTATKHIPVKASRLLNSH